MDLTRKEFVAAMSGTSLAALVPSVARSQASSTAHIAPFSDRVLRNLPSDDDIWEMELKLASYCPTFTASKGHKAFVDMLAGQLAKAGIEPQRQTFRMPYWEPHSYGLMLDGKVVPVTGFRPHSGPTGPQGVAAPMTYVGKGAELDLSNVRGKIALIDVPVVRSSQAGGNIVDVYPKSERPANYVGEASPLSSGMGAPRFTTIEAAGAVGVIYIWNGISDDNSMYQMQPFFGPPSPVPAIWVGEKRVRS